MDIIIIILIAVMRWKSLKDAVSNNSYNEDSKRRDIFLPISPRRWTLSKLFSMSITKHRRQKPLGLYKGNSFCYTQKEMVILTPASKNWKAL